MKANYAKKYHMDVDARALLKLIAHRLDVPIALLPSTYLKEWKLFTSEMNVYKKKMWNARDALEGKAVEWHELHSFGRT